MHCDPERKVKNDYDRILSRIAKEEESNDAMDEETLKEQESGIMELGNK